MTESYRIPGQVDVSTRFFGKFTAGDLIRIGLPVLAALIPIYRSNNVPAWMFGQLGVALLTGAAWYLWRPYGRPLDHHAYHLVRWLVGRRNLDERCVEGLSDDVILTEYETAIGVLEVEPTNLEMKTEPEQGALHSIYQDLIGSVTYPVHVYSRQQPIDLDNYANRIRDTDSPRKDLKNDYLNYIESLSEGNLTTTRHYIVIRVTQSDLPWLRTWLYNTLPVDLNTSYDASIQTLIAELDGRCSEVRDAITTADITAERVTGRELEELVRDFENPDPNVGSTWSTRPWDDNLGRYRRTAAITEFPSTVDLGWPLRILRTDGLVDVTQVIQPRNDASTSKKLQRLSQKLNAEIDSFLRQGYHGTNKLEGLLDDIEWMLNLLADREDTTVDYAAYVSAHSESREECSQTFEQVCNRLQTMQIEYELPVFRTDLAYYTDAPLYPDRVDQSQLMPASAAAAGFPFATQDTDQQRGVIYGVDTSDETPVLLNRFAWSSHSMARMGMVGSGKSYATKLELLRAALAYDDLQIYVVDPKQEYSHLVNTLDGTVHTLDDRSNPEFDGADVLGYQVDKRGQQENVDQLVDVVRQIYDKASQDTRKTLVVIDEARILMNDEDGRQVLNQFVLEGRDTNTAVTLISQNASHFTFCREGREILDNMPGKVFMRHDRVPDSVVDYFDLSQREQQELYELKTGTDANYSEALLKVSGRLDTRAAIIPSGAEDAIIQAGENA